MYQPKRVAAHHSSLPFTISAVFLTVFGICGWSLQFIAPTEDLPHLPAYTSENIITVSDAQAYAAIDKRKAELAPNAQLIKRLAKIDEAGNNILTKPLSGPIRSPFGYRIHPISGTYKLHSGIDIGTPCGSIVRAAAPGKVTGSSYLGGFGNLVKIRHSSSLETLYAHLSAFKVKVGDTVSTGDIIGLSGTTGNSTGCHLHFQVEYKGKPVNPLNYLKK